MIVPLPGGGCDGEFEPAPVAELLPPVPLVPDPEGFIPPKPPLKPLPGSPMPGRMVLVPPLTFSDPIPVAPPLIVSVIAVLLPRLPVVVATDEPVEFAELPVNVPLEPPLENPPPPPEKPPPPPLPLENPPPPE